MNKKLKVVNAIHRKKKKRAKAKIKESKSKAALPQVTNEQTQQ